ncbi:MAG: MBL fold metallo-hydrolase [Chloroflexi bacterium]|nr:MBL fold metallo-hydrolase [Chloroflexota bacterium]MBI3732417.1 MBL fold metallo-hydrolase [Chloroflexota bacterium]
MDQITEHVYVHQDSRDTNLGVIITADRPILVDSPMLPADARQWRDAIQRLSLARPLYIINSDHHIGHALGNWAFPDTPAIAHRHAAHLMLEKYDSTFRSRLVDSFRATEPEVAADLETIAMPRPRLGVVDEMELNIGDLLIELIHVGGHTPGTLMVRVPADDVVFTGDVVVQGRYPGLSDANSLQWLAALEKIVRLHARYIVPGHGQSATIQTLQDIDGFIRYIRESVSAYYATGLSRKDVVSRIRAVEGFTIEDSDQARSEQRLKSSVQRVYDELKERDKEIEKARSD